MSPLSLSPDFIPWALAGFAIVAVGVFFAWLVVDRELTRIYRRLWLSDAVAAWLGFAAGYHLIHLRAWRTLLGEPVALWLLIGAIGVYLALRRAPTPLRRPEVLLALAALMWSLVIVAGFRHLEQSEAEAAVLAARPAGVTATNAPNLAPLRRALLLSRMEPELRAQTAKALAMLSGSLPRDKAFLITFRLRALPRLHDWFQHNLARLWVFQWVQLAMLAVVLAIWGMGHAPERRG